MFFTYLRRELRRRMRQAILISLGLALGVGLVITVSAASNGVKAAQGTVLQNLYGVGTSATVTSSRASDIVASCGTTSFASVPPESFPSALSLPGPSSWLLPSSPLGGWSNAL